MRMCITYDISINIGISDAHSYYLHQMQNNISALSLFSSDDITKCWGLKGSNVLMECALSTCIKCFVCETGQERQL